MGNRKLVPAALHSELTEYSSLIRALRASDTLDVTSHLVKARSSRNFDDDKELDSQDDESDDDHEQDDLFCQGEAGHDHAGPASEIDFPASSVFDSRDVSPSHNVGSSSPAEGSPLSCRKRKRQSSPSYPQRRRDAWTRWPLLVDDLHVPEWSFEDEIAHLAESTMKRYSQQSEEEAQHSEDHAAEDAEGYPSYLPHLTAAASNHLSTILALLVAHAPNRPHSQQNRVEPMDWRTVLNVLSSCGDPSLADPKIISIVKTRMEALHDITQPNKGPHSEVLVAHRIQRCFTAKQKLNAELSMPSKDLFDSLPPPKGWTPWRSHRRPLRKVRRPLPKTPARVEDEVP